MCVCFVNVLLSECMQPKYVAQRFVSSSSVCVHTDVCCCVGYVCVFLRLLSEARKEKKENPLSWSLWVTDCLSAALHEQVFFKVTCNVVPQPFSLLSSVHTCWLFALYRICSLLLEGCTLLNQTDEKTNVFTDTETVVSSCQLPRCQFPKCREEFTDKYKC